MKRDPFVNPLPLGKPPLGGWKFHAEKGYFLADPNFWTLARRIVDFRKANKIKGTDFEAVQLEVLLENRTRLGLTIKDRVLLDPPPGSLSPVQQFVAKRKRRCRSCGRKPR